MRRSLALRSEVLLSLDQTGSEELRPDSVHGHARGERVVGMSQPLRDAEPIRGSLGRERVKVCQDRRFDDITLFEYVKKNSREFGPALVGIELSTPGDLAPLLARMKTIGLRYETVEPGSVLYRFLV